MEMGVRMRIKTNPNDKTQILLSDLNRRLVSLEEAMENKLWSPQALAANREEQMVQLYGECCSQTKAAEILGCCARTVNRMIDSGTLKVAGNGKVDVRSLAQFIENPKKKNVSMTKRLGKRQRFAV